MTEEIEGLRYFAILSGDADGWTVACSCGHLVTGFPTQALAQAELSDHAARCHPIPDASE